MLAHSPPHGFVKRSVKYGPYSPSRLIVAKCPQRFFGQYIRKDRSVVSTMAAARGNAIHHVLSLITKALVNQETLTPKQVSGWVHESVGLFPAAYEQVDLIRDAANAYVANPSPYMNSKTDTEIAFAVAFYEEDSFVDEVVGRRAYVAVPYAGENGLPNPEAFFGGRLDQVNVDHITKTVTILDHKSTPSMNKNEDHNFQLGCYAWLVSLFYPGYQIKTVIHYCHPALNTYAPPVYWSQDELKDFEAYIHSRIWSIEQFTEFPALPGAACDYCHMIQECPENLALREQKARGQVDLNARTVEDLKRLASNLRVTGALYDELNKALKQGIEALAPENGIAIEGMWYGFKASDEAVDWISTDLKIREESMRAKQLLVDGVADDALRRKYEMMAKLPDLAAVLKHWGVDPGVFKEWQGQKLKNLWKLDKPALLDMLKDYVVKKRDTRFSGYKN
jgi:hypothetical protein